eukprot:IDg19804t1
MLLRHLFSFAAFFHGPTPARNISTCSPSAIRRNTLPPLKSRMDFQRHVQDNPNFKK